jgi:hypothetical protein
MQIKRSVLWSIATLLVSAQAVLGQRIDFKDVLLSDAIRTLANQTFENFILDPALQASTNKITQQWESSDAKSALLQILKEHELKLIESKASSVTEITFSKKEPVTVKSELFGNEGTAVPLIVMDYVSLKEALTRLAAEAKLDIRTSSEIANVQNTVSFRWKNVSVKKALIALCETYNLIATKDSDNAILIAPQNP